MNSSDETNSITAEGITLVVSDDPRVQREQILRFWNAWIEKEDMGPRLVMIARKMGKSLDRLERVERWESGLVVLAMDYLVGGICEVMYAEMLRLQSEGGENGNQSGRSGAKKKGKNHRTRGAGSGVDGAGDGVRDRGL